LDDGAAVGQQPAAEPDHERHPSTGGRLQIRHRPTHPLLVQRQFGDADVAGGITPQRGLGLPDEDVERPVGGPRHRRHRREAQPLVHRGTFRVVDPGHHPGHPERLPRHPRRDDVGVVAGGYRGERAGLLDPGTQQHIPVEAHTHDPFPGAVRAEPVKRRAVPGDHRDVVPDPRQAVGQHGAHPTASHHHNPQLDPSFRKRVVSYRRLTCALRTLQLSGGRWPRRLVLALVSKVSTAARRLLLGRPFRSDRLSHTLLPKRIALPVFASDALSSVAYAPEEIFVVLSVAGVAAYAMTPWIGLAIATVMALVIASYRHTVQAYPSGGGACEVVSTNLGRTAGLTVAAALMVDYVLTVAVSISAAMSNIGSVIGFIGEHKVWFAVAAILLVAAMNLRGVRESGAAFAVP